MNIWKTSGGVFKIALRFSRHKSLLAQLGSSLQGEHTHINKSEFRQASFWGCISTAEPAVSGLRYYSQDDHFRAPMEKSLELRKPAKLQSLPELPRTSESGVSIFYQQLNECSSPSDVLDLVNNSELTHKRVSNSLSRIWESIKKMSDDQRRYELKLMFEHQGLEELCKWVILKAPLMQPRDMAYSLLALVRLGVPQQSKVVQTLLRVIQENLNRLDERCLSILAGALEQMDSSQNVEALKQGLRLRLENDMSLIKTVLSLQLLMRAVGRDSSDTLKKKFEKKALAMSKDFTLPNAQYMLASMARIGFNSRPLLEFCCQKIEENVEVVPFSRLMMILKACQDLHYRNFSLLSSIDEHVATSCAMWSNKQVILLFLEFERLGFHPSKLMDVFAERVIQNPDALNLKDLLSVLKVYSLLNHDLGDRRQPFLDGLTKAVEAYRDRLQPDILLRAVHSFCILEHFPIFSLERLLQEGTLNQLLNPETAKNLLKNLHAVDVCLRLDQTGLPHPLSVSSVLDDLDTSPSLPPPPGLFSMLKDLEGVENVVEHQVVEKIHHIDFVISLSSEMSQVDKALQDQPPRKLAVLCAYSSAYCFGTSRLRGKMAMKTRHLRILGYSPVLVPVQEWVLLPETEKLVMLKKLVFPEQDQSSVDSAATVNSVEE